MSEISTRLREFVNDPSVSDHYGEWGALRPDQRRQIRELCDVCDGYERAADNSMFELEKRKWIPVTKRLPTEDDANADYAILAIHKRSVKRYFHWKSVADNPFDFTYWIPLPEPPKTEKGGVE